MNLCYRPLKGDTESTYSVLRITHKEEVVPVRHYKELRDYNISYLSCIVSATAAYINRFELTVQYRKLLARKYADSQPHTFPCPTNVVLLNCVRKEFHKGTDHCLSHASVHHLRTPTQLSHMSDLIAPESSRHSHPSPWLP